MRIWFGIHFLYPLVAAYQVQPSSNWRLGESPDAYVTDYLADSLYMPDQRQVAVDLGLTVSVAAQHNFVFLRLDFYIEITHVATRHQSSLNFGSEH